MKRATVLMLMTMNGVGCAQPLADARCQGVRCCGGAVQAVLDGDELSCRDRLEDPLQSCFIDVPTRRAGLHACPMGTYVGGLDGERLLCCYSNDADGLVGDEREVARDAPLFHPDAVLTGIEEDRALMRRLAAPVTPLPRAERPPWSWEQGGLPLGPELPRHFDHWRAWARTWLRHALDLPTAAPPPPEVLADARRTVGEVTVLTLRYWSDFEQPRDLNDGSASEMMHAYLLLPEGGPVGGRPAVLLFHGHDADAKEGTVFLEENPHHAAGLALAKAGFVVLAPDTRGFGSSRPVHFSNAELLARSAESHPYHAAYTSSLPEGAMMQRFVRDALTHVSVLAGRREVDARAIYTVGLSLGGVQSLWTAAIDPRVAGASVAGIFVSQETIHAGGHHECQRLPAIRTPTGASRIESWDLAALIWPRPLHLMWGSDDSFFADAADERALEVYGELNLRLSGAARLAVDVIPDMGHELHVPSVLAFLDEQARP